jgi:hypothetical protein
MVWKSVGPLSRDRWSESAFLQRRVERTSESGLHRTSIRRHRIDSTGEDDRDRRGRVFRRQYRSGAARPDHIDLAADEIGGHRGQPVIVTLCPAEFDRQILSVDVPRFTQSLTEGRHCYEVDACSGALEMLNPQMKGWGIFELYRRRYEEQLDEQRLDGHQLGGGDYDVIDDPEDGTSD